MSEQQAQKLAALLTEKQKRDLLLLVRVMAQAAKEEAA